MPVIDRIGAFRVDESAYSAVSVCIHDGDIDLTLMNGRKVAAPLWLFPELTEMTEDDLNDVELIEGGLGVLIGDKEAVTVLRITGLDSDKVEAKSLH